MIRNEDQLFDEINDTLEEIDGEILRGNFNQENGLLVWVGLLQARATCLNALAIHMASDKSPS